MPLKQGMYSGLSFAKYPATTYGAGAVDDFVDGLVAQNKQDAIVSIFMMPTSFVDSSWDDETIPSSQGPFWVYMPYSLDGYTPKNKKLLTYPYNFLCADVLSDSKIYKYELSDATNTNPDTQQVEKCFRFNFFCGVSPNPEIVMTPTNYNGTNNAVFNNWTESITIADFPQCAFIIDAYKAWLAQKANASLITSQASAAGFLMSAATGSAIGMLATGASLASSLNNMAVASSQGSKARGGIGASTEVAARSKGVYFKKMCLKYDYAVVADNFLSRYGYACEKIKIPNRNVRTSWTYCKTRDCAAHGNVPAEAMENIKKIYNNGITWWNKNADIGNYAQTNNVLT